jgi:hypothetical protein
MKTIKRSLLMLMTGILLNMIVSCSNKVESYVSQQENFIEKWESKLLTGTLNETDRKAFDEEQSELEKKNPLTSMDVESIQELHKWYDTEEGQKLTELNGKIVHMALTVRFNLPYSPATDSDF